MNGPNTFVRRVWFALAAFLLLSGSWVSASQATTSKVQVTATSGDVKVVIAESSELRVVLDAVCDQLQLNCQIPAELPGVVSPSTLEGTVQEIVSQLLDGAKVNYAFLPAKVGEKGTLLVERRSSAEIPAPVPASNMSPVPAPPVTMQNPPSEQAMDSAVSGAPPADNSADMSSNSSAAAPIAESLPQSVMDGSAVALPYASALGQPVIVPLNPDAPRYLPYPDANGNPIPAPPITGIRYLPYPDANGNPIPAPAPTGIHYMPYPDANGNPVPIRH